MERNSVARIDEPQGITIGCAHYSEFIDDPALCISLTTGRTENELCISSKCESVFKVCPACLAQGELKRIGHRPETCCEAGKELCAFHLASGIGTKRKQVEAERIKKTSFSFDLSRMMAASSPEEKPIIEECPPEAIVNEELGYFIVNRSRVRPNPEQPRKHFSKAKLQDLANSISEFGQKDPISIRRIYDDPDHEWELVDGERRFRACGMLGIEEMKAVVDNPSDKKFQYLDSVILNFNNETHTPMEIAQAIKQIKDDFKFSDEKIGKTVFGGKSGVWVGGYLRLLTLHPDVQARLNPDLPEKEQLNASVAIYLARQESDQGRQLEITDEIIKKEMKTNYALAFIRDKAIAHHSQERRETLRGKCRKRRPSDDYCILHDFLVRTERHMTLYGDMGRAKLKNMFAHRPFDDREKICGMLLRVSRDAKKIRDILEEMT